MHLVVKAERPSTAKTLYPYQEEAIKDILTVLDKNAKKQNLLFQLPTGGGKTIIFSEVVRRYINLNKEKVLILTHRIELLRQTAKTLEETGVPSKLITSEVKELDKKESYACFLAMVETLNNRLQEDEHFLDHIDLVIVDEAHYNSFRKIFQYFKDAVIFGVTATPLSSNLNNPLNRHYKKLIVGDSISDLIDKGYLSNAETYTYDVKLKSLKVGTDGDFTVSSLDKVYGSSEMHDKLMVSYLERAKNTKTLIFNSSISTSKSVYENFKKAGLDIKHLDSTNQKKERIETLQWFKETPNAILTSVGILTTGFDEPTVETIILNRATRSLTLYHQMIGRGSRTLPNKKQFNIIDLGDNARRLGLWKDYIDWNEIFINPLTYLEYLTEREQEMEKGLHYIFPEELKSLFPNTNSFDFDIAALYAEQIHRGLSTIKVIDMSLDNHYSMILENAEDLFEGVDLMNSLEDDIRFRLSVYTHCMAKTTNNYFNWLFEDYQKKLKQKLRSTLPIPAYD